MPISRNEEIKYSYTGDVSSLQKATKDAIAALHKYENAFKSTAKAGNMDVSARSVSSFSKQVNSAYGSVTELYRMLQKISRSGVDSINGVDKAAESMTRNFNAALQAIKNLGKIGDSDLKNIESVLNKAASQAESISNKVRGANVQFDAMHEKASKVSNSSKGIAENIDRVTKSAKESAEVFERMYREQNKFNRRTPGYNTDKTFRASKSARESADAFRNSYDREFNWWGLQARPNYTGGVGFEETIPIIQRMGISFDQAATSAFSFVRKITAVTTTLRTLKEIIEEVVKLLANMVTTMGKIAATGLGTAFVAPFKTVATILQGIYELTGGNWGQRLGEFFSEGVKGAIDMIETLNLFNVAMGESIKTGNEFVNTFSDALGLDSTNMQNTIGLFYEMGAAVGVPADTASELALGMEKLALNVSSLFNVDIETVSNNLISGLRGMSRAVVKYGMDIRASTVQEKLNELGITAKFKTMNEASREIARYIVMVEQAADANMDFTETLNNPANQLRIFKEQIVQLGRTIGTFFVNVLGDVIIVINGIVMAIRLIVEEIARIFGLFTGASVSVGIEDTTDSAIGGIGGIGDAADSTSKKLNDMLAPFDELNILSKNLGSSGGAGGAGGGVSSDIIDPRLLKELDKVESKLGEIHNAATDVRDRILEFLGLKYKMVLDLDTGEVVSKLEVIPGQFADKLIQAVQRDDWTRVGELIGEKLNEVINMANNFVTSDDLANTIIGVVTRAAETVNGFVSAFDWYNLGQLIGNSIKLAITSFDAFITVADLELWGQKLADLFNGFIATFDDGYLGTAIANWLNKCVDFAIGFAYQFDFTAFGNTLATNLNNFINKLNFENVGRVLATWLNNMVEYAAAFNNTFDWTGFEAKLVASLEVFFSVFDFHKFLTTATEIINHLISALETVVNTVDWFSIGYEIGEALKRIDWESLMSSVAKVIINTLGGLLTSLLPSLLRSILDSALNNLTLGLYGKVTKTPGLQYPTTSGLVNVPYKVVSQGDQAVRNWLISQGKVPQFATGGVVTGPTNAIIGEGRYDEAVIPLGNSPQLQEMLQKFAAITATLLSEGSYGASSYATAMNSMNTFGGGGEGADLSYFTTNFIAALSTQFSETESSEFYPTSDAMLSKLNESLAETVSELDWNGVGTAIQEALTSLDWSTILSPVASSIATTLQQLVEPKVNSLISSISVSVNSSLSSSIRGGGSSGYGKFDGVAMYPVLSNPKKFWSSNPQLKGWSNKIKDGHFIFGAPMATGGVVTGPTRALIGEGLYEEAVIPLGNSPQMQEMLNKFAEVSSNSSKNEPIEVRVYIGDKEWDSFTYQSAQRGSKLVGASPIREDG